MKLNISVKNIKGLGIEEAEKLQELFHVYNAHESKNRLKNRYYEGHVTLGEVNLGIALPNGMKGLEIGCEWGGKSVDVLASRSMFDGFVGVDGEEATAMAQIMRDNKLKAAYSKACRDELKFGCTFATLSSDEQIGCRIRFHTPQTAAAVWDGEKERIGYGFAIIDTQKDESDQFWKPSLLNLYTDTAIWVIFRNGDNWFAEEHSHNMGRPLMEALIWNPTSAKPFGRSRIKEPVRRLIQGYVRTIANASIGLEFSTAPQKYLLGATDEQLDALVDSKFQQYVGSMIGASTNPETGEKPTFGQLTQGNISPHVEMLRVLATQFSAATGLTVTDTGVVNDANPTSSDAILAQSQTLVLMAEQLNNGNADSLYTIAMMAQAIKGRKTLDQLDESETNIIAHFKNPAMPSVAVTADAAIKIASARPAFSQTSTFLEMIGFSQADIRRIKGEEQIARGLALLDELEV